MTYLELEELVIINGGQPNEFALALQTTDDQKNIFYDLSLKGKYLLANTFIEGMSFDINSVYKERKTFLAYAVDNRHFDVTKYFIHIGANIYDEYTNGQSIADFVKSSYAGTRLEYEVNIRENFLDNEEKRIDDFVKESHPYKFGERKYNTKVLEEIANLAWDNKKYEVVEAAIYLSRLHKPSQSSAKYIPTLAEMAYKEVRSQFDPLEFATALPGLAYKSIINSVMNKIKMRENFKKSIRTMGELKYTVYYNNELPILDSTLCLVFRNTTTALETFTKPQLTAFIYANNKFKTCLLPMRVNWALLPEGEHEKAISETKVLLDHGADPNIPYHNGFPPLCLASQMNEESVVRLLLDYGADPNIKSESGRTALHLTNETGITGTLLMYGADPNTTDNYGESPYEQACIYPRIQEHMDLLKAYL